MIDDASSDPGFVQAAVHQREGYVFGSQGLPWNPAPVVPPPAEDVAASFLHQVREGGVALRGRIKDDAYACRDAFQEAIIESFPKARNKPFTGAVARLWVRWLGASVDGTALNDALSFSRDTGRRAGEILKTEYEEGLAGGFAGFLLDKRIHLLRIRQFLRMKGWLVGTIEHDSNSPDAGVRERAGILQANFSSIVLRALHNAGCDYPARVVAKLESLMKDLDLAAANLANTEPEAGAFLRNNRATIITRALHSGRLGYGHEATKALPNLLKRFESRVAASTPEDAEKLLAKRRTLIYRALTNGRLTN